MLSSTDRGWLLVQGIYRVQKHFLDSADGLHHSAEHKQEIDYKRSNRFLQSIDAKEEQYER
jgi:hypothetical protein